jgi:hypothetical protein
VKPASPWAQADTIKIDQVWALEELKANLNMSLFPYMFQESLNDFSPTLNLEPILITST